MPIIINDKTKCTGCGACQNICPKNCIKMLDDTEGFSYPKVDTNTCVNCELCVTVCPVIKKNDDKQQNSNIKVYAGWSNDKDIRYNSTSGGVFSELASKIIENDGYVVGAVYNEECDVEHAIVNDKCGLERVRQSKYTQSDVKYIYREVKQLLEQEKTVLFCGAPCQVAGLRGYLRKDYNNLVTVDFICRGMNSPKAYRYWLKELEEKYNSKAVKVWFKYKENGWKKSPQCTRVDFADGNYCVQSGYNNSYMRGYLGPNLYIRPSCSDCKFKSVNRLSDITLADFWGIAQELDDDKGTSLILLNTAKGKKLFDSIKSKVFYEERAIEEIVEGNVCFNESVQLNPKSHEFLEKLGSEPFSSLVDKYARVSIITRGRKKIMKIISKIVDKK